MKKMESSFSVIPSRNDSQLHTVDIGSTEMNKGLKQNSKLLTASVALMSGYIMQELGTIYDRHEAYVPAALQYFACVTMLATWLITNKETLRLNIFRRTVTLNKENLAQGMTRGYFGNEVTGPGPRY